MTWSAKLAPWPSVADAGRAVDFYKSAFGAVEPERLEGDVGVLQVARLGIGEADFWVQFDPGGSRTRQDEMAQCSSSGKSVDSWHPSQLRLSGFARSLRPRVSWTDQRCKACWRMWRCSASTPVDVQRVTRRQQAIRPLRYPA